MTQDERSIHALVELVVLQADSDTAYATQFDLDRLFVPPFDGPTSEPNDLIVDSAAPPRTERHDRASDRRRTARPSGYGRHYFSRVSFSELREALGLSAIATDATSREG